MANANVEVVKNGNETATNLIRRFTKRMQGSGVLSRVRSLRYSSRTISDFARKKKALAILTKKEYYEEMSKLGRQVVTKKGGRR